jgi:hypothetical protein
VAGGAATAAAARALARQRRTGNEPMLVGVAKERLRRRICD